MMTSMLPHTYRRCFLINHYTAMVSRPIADRLALVFNCRWFTITRSAPRIPCGIEAHGLTR